MSSVGHCDTSEVVAYLNGECSRSKAKRIQRHLAQCWSCRHLQASLEEEIQSLVGAFEEWRLEDSVTCARHLENLSDRVSRLEAEGPAPRARWRFPFGKLSLTIAVSALIVVSSLILVVKSSFPDPFQQARSREVRISRSPALKQRFSLTLNEAKTGRSLNTSLEILADLENGRYQQLWRSSDGTLLYGYWQPRESRKIVYDLDGGLRPRRPSSPRPQTVSPLPAESGLGSLEQAISEWFEERGPAPVELTKDCLLLSSLPPTKDSRQSLSLDGAWRIRWVESPQARLETLELRLRGTSFLARAQVLMLGPGVADSNLKITLIDSRPLSVKSIDAAQFEPPPDLIMARSSAASPNVRVLRGL